MCPPFNRFFAPHRRRRRLWILAATTVLTGVATGYFALEMEKHGVGILEFEFTRTAADAERHYGDLGSDGRTDAMWSLLLDYPYLVSYGLLLIGAAIAVGERSLRARRPALAGLAPWIAWGALGAATFDAVENTALLLVLDGNTGQPWPAIAYGCAMAKFVLIAAALLYIAGGLLLALRRPRPVSRAT